jgi:hypothetical protein
VNEEGGGSAPLACTALNLAAAVLCAQAAPTVGITVDQQPVGDQQ